MKFRGVKKQICFITIFFLSLQLSFSIDSSTAAKKEIKKIENNINIQNEKIKKVDTQKEAIEAQIKKNEAEINNLKKKQNKISEEIKKVEISLLKNNKELKKTDGELKKIKLEHESELIAWNRYSIFKSPEEMSEIDKFSAQKLIFKNVNEIKQTEGTVLEIKEENKEIEEKRKQLKELNFQANKNKNKLNKKIDEQEELVKKLNKNKLNYEAVVKTLKIKKSQIEKEIDKILNVKKTPKKKTSSVKYSTAKKGVGRLEKPLSGEIVTRYKESKSGIALNGIEIRGELGSAIKSSSKGKVIYSDNFQGLGKVVMIEYGYDLIGIYGNLISTDVKVGDLVAKSEKIGILGYSNDGQPDLYYEVRFNMKSVNPESFF